MDVEREELTKVSSDYLCTECKGLIYTNLNAKKDVCINPSCSKYPAGTEFANVPEATALKKEVEDIKQKLLFRLLKNEPSAFTSYVYSQRRALITNRFSTTPMDYERFFGLNEIILDLSKHRPMGRETTVSVFDKLIWDYVELSKSINLIDDIESERYLISISPRKETFIVKYFKVFLELYANYGIVNQNEIHASSLFRYKDIDSQVKEEVKITPRMEFQDYFVQLFDFIIGLKYLLFIHYRTSLQFKYAVGKVDIPVLLGLFFSVDTSLQSWSTGGLEAHFNKYTEWAEGRTFSEFSNEYISNTAKSPIIVPNGNSNLIDRETLLFYILHLVGLYSENLPRNDAKVETLADKKELASQVFEVRIRELLTAKAFDTPSEAVKVAEGGEEYEYDAIGVNEAKKVIILVEAKYKDFAPSSISGKTLIRQEVLLKKDDKGLLWTAIRQQKRYKFFCQHFARFKERLKIQGELTEYNVEPFVVTKYTPIFSKYEQVKLADFGSFIELLEKGY